MSSQYRVDKIVCVFGQKCPPYFIDYIHILFAIKEK